MFRREIKVYRTHIEVFPYMQGECKSIEDSYSVYDPIFYKTIPVAYTVYNDTLYLPRGTSIPYLERTFGTKAVLDGSSDLIKSIKIKSIIEPRSRIQREAVDFLCSKDRFTKGEYKPQLSLNLEPGDGKTIAAILSICKKYKCKTIIILHQTKLKNQWRAEFHKASNISDDKIVDIVGSNMMDQIANKDISGDIYLVNHQTIHAYAALYGWDKVKKFFAVTGIGLKVFDEAHKYFSNIMFIDFFSNTNKTIYLTATFTRTQYKEKYMFKRAFSNCYRFGEETSNYEEKRHHVIDYYVMYNSNPDPSIVPGMYNKYSISSFKYIDYSLHYDENMMMYKVIKMVIDKTKALRGKTIITSPKIESSEIIANYIANNFDKTVSIVNSSKSREDNESATNADIISSTIKSLGTGIDIKGLRILINVEPFTSEANMTQLKGRLREFSSDDDTFFFDIVDVGFTDIKRMGEIRKRTMKKFAKEIRIIDLT